MSAPATRAQGATKHESWADERFHAAAEYNAGAGIAMYRKCRRCGGQALEGALSAHARRCDKQHAAATLAAFDALSADDRRARIDRATEVRIAARDAL